MTTPKDSDETRILRTLEESRRFTEEVLRDNERLRLLVARLRADAVDPAETLRLQERIRILEGEVEDLKRQNSDLRQQFSGIENENAQFATRYVHIEQDYSDLIQLYVATQRLHSTIDLGEVLAVVREIVINLVGSEHFGIYLLADEGRRPTLVASEGLAPEEVSAVSPEMEAVKRAVGGETYVAPDGGAPLACIPLKVGDKVLGLIVIWGLLVQKPALKPSDFGLFDLLVGHAATALLGATLHALTTQGPTVDDLLRLVKEVGPPK